MKKYVSLLMVFLVALVMFSGCESETKDEKTKVTLDPKELTVKVGEPMPITATTKPANKKLTWSSSNTDIAVVENGLVSGVYVGEAVITAKAKDGGSAKCTVTVVSGTTITLNPTALEVEVNEAKPIVATVTPGGKALTWTSSDTEVATVAATGTTTRQITGVKVGPATIIVTTEDGARAECTVTVTAQTPTVITLDPTSPLSVEVYESKSVTATISTPGRSLDWTSNDPSTVTVSGSGLTRQITGVKEGSTTVTVAPAAPAIGESVTLTVNVSKATRNFTEVDGETMIHHLPKLYGVPHFGTNLGTDNADGSYTFDGTATGTWSGGGAQYDFPTPRTGETWDFSEYNLVEVHLKVTSGSVNVGVKRSGGNVNLTPYPGTDSAIAFNSTTNGGVFTYKTVIGEAGTGIGFQRNTGGPATVQIDKVVFSKGTMHTISFAGGEYAAMPAIESFKIPTGRTVNLYGSYVVPSRVKWAGHTFTGWKDAGNADFDVTATITKDLVLTAQWEAGDPPPVPMTLNLNPTSWPPYPTNTTSYPSKYADYSYDDVTGKLTFTFDGNNRQMGLIALSEDQANELLDTTDVPGITIRLDIEVTDDGSGVGRAKGDDGKDEVARFRTHVGNPGMTPWNSTAGGPETPITDPEQLVDYRTFENRNAGYRWFFFTAMYKHPVSGDTADRTSEFPKVTIIVNSITLDLGDTRDDD
jgi:uncharacterized protein YjdB